MIIESNISNQKKISDKNEKIEEEKQTTQKVASKSKVQQSF